MSDENKFERARKAFDVITTASYYGFTFREHLATHPDALKAAEALAASIQARKAFWDDLCGGGRQ